MGLFGRGERKGSKGDSAEDGTRILVGGTHYCRICDTEMAFTRCWRRVRPVRQCGCCGLVFENCHALYARFQPACPRCGEFLEQPGFDYGLCDGCGSRYEIVEGTKPGLLPNRRQREEMDAIGKMRSID